MTARTSRGRDVGDDAPAAADDAEATAEAGSTAKAAPGQQATSKKRVRRVRVIEVIDDGDDLDEDADDDIEDVLNALDEAAVDSKVTDGADEAGGAVQADKHEPDDEAAIPAVTAGAGAGAGATARSRSWGLALGSPRTTTALVVVLIGVLGALAIWQWRQAATLAEEQDERREVAKVAGEYGNVIYSYTPATAQQAIKDNLRMLGGDALATYKQTTAVNLPEFFAKNPQVTMNSTIKQVFVGDINGELATAVILLDVRIHSAQGDADGSNTLLRLALKKEPDGWKVTEQKTSGEADGSTSAGQLPLPGGNATTSPTGTATPKQN